MEVVCAHEDIRKSCMNRAIWGVLIVGEPKLESIHETGQLHEAHAVPIARGRTPWLLVVSFAVILGVSVGVGLTLLLLTTQQAPPLP